MKVTEAARDVLEKMPFGVFMDYQFENKVRRMGINKDTRERTIQRRLYQYRLGSADSYFIVNVNRNCKFKKSYRAGS